jgi:hypothetical protein
MQQLPMFTLETYHLLYDKKWIKGKKRLNQFVTIYDDEWVAIIALECTTWKPHPTRSELETLAWQALRQMKTRPYGDEYGVGPVAITYLFERG